MPDRPTVSREEDDVLDARAEAQSARGAAQRAWAAAQRAEGDLLRVAPDAAQRVVRDPSDSAGEHAIEILEIRLDRRLPHGSSKDVTRLHAQAAKLHAAAAQAHANVARGAADGAGWSNKDAVPLSELTAAIVLVNDTYGAAADAKRAAEEAEDALHQIVIADPHQDGHKVGVRELVNQSRDANRTAVAAAEKAEFLGGQTRSIAERLLDGTEESWVRRAMRWPNENAFHNAELLPWARPKRMMATGVAAIVAASLLGALAFAVADGGMDEKVFATTQELVYATIGVLAGILIGAIAHKTWRGSLLLRHRLADLSLGYGLRNALSPLWIAIAISGIGFAVLAVACGAFENDVLNSGEADRWINRACASWGAAAQLVLAATFAASIGSLCGHVVDFSLMQALLRRRQGDRVQNALRSHTATHIASQLHDDIYSDQDDEEARKNVLVAAETRVRDLERQISPWVEIYGVAAYTYEADYLPVVASVHLQISQLRALNTAPRRVQLVGRRWTRHGLDSEYVVVHDVSDLRTNFPAEPPPNIEGWRGRDGSRDKYRVRSLKKRATVRVAPDGYLRAVEIEEERQFNI